MSNKFDVELHDMASLNEQMLGSKGSEIIDVTATSTTEDSASRKFRFRKLTRRQMGYLAGAVFAAVVVVTIVVKKQNETHLDVVLPANISAVLEKPVTKPPMPVDQPSSSSVDVAITAPAADIAATLTSTPASSTPQPASGVAADTASSSFVPSDLHSRVRPSPVAIEIDPLKKELAAVKNELASKTAEIAALKSAAAKPKSVKLATTAVAATEKSAAKPVVVAKPKLKETHDLSMKASGIAVLMDSGLIYSSESGDFVEVSINQNFPGYGKLVRVDKDAKTFETPSHIYFLKD